MDGAQFLQFLGSRGVNVENDEVYHIFIRDGLFCLHNSQARDIARLFFKSEGSGAGRVVKKEGNLETLNVGKILVGRICATLLQLNKRIVLWNRKGSSWEPEREASPGNYVSLTNALGQVFTKAIEDGEASAQPVIACLHKCPTTGRVGAAIAHTNHGILQLFEFADDSDWGLLESVLVQQGVREVVVAAPARRVNTAAAVKTVIGVDGAHEEDSSPTRPKKKAKVTVTPSSNSAAPAAGGGGGGGGGGGEFAAAAAYDGQWVKLFSKTGVAITIVADNFFRLPKSSEGGSIMDDLAALLPPAARDQSDRRNQNLELNHAATMHHAQQALSALFLHLDLRSPEYTGSFRLEIGQPDSVLAYDASVSAALCVFPEHGGDSAYSFDLSELMGAENEGAQGEDDGDNIAGEAKSKSMGGRRGRAPDSLFALLDQTKTRSGQRLLRTWLQQPLRNLQTIRARQDFVEMLLASTVIRLRLRESTTHLNRCPDLDKIAHKFRSPLNPRAGLGDLISIYRAVLRLKTCGASLSECLPKPLAVGGDASVPTINNDNSTASALLGRIDKCVGDMGKLLALVEEVIDTRSLAAPSSRSDADLWGSRWLQVRPDFSAELKQISSRLETLQADILSEHKRVAKAAGVETKSLHLERSAVHGLHLRATKKDAAKLLKALEKSGEGCRTLSSQKQGTLFLTTKLGRLVAALETARLEYSAAQEAVVHEAIEVATTFFPVMQDAGSLIAELDVLSCLAHVASSCGWTRPEVVDSIVSDTNEADDITVTNKRLHLVQLRHPLVETVVGTGKYVSSDLDLRAGQRCAILTGPNMGGKSTFCRAVGLTVLLAHMGSFVPCERAVIPLHDRILARVGASDSLSMGLSTFMAEMMDIAKILKRATAQSLVITDEIGRGTSSSDGFGIAWAAIQRLACEIRCVSLFATHYHELTQLETLFPQFLINLHVSAHVDSASNKVTMLFAVQPGASQRSYGIACAKVAGFPLSVIEDAERLERDLEIDGGNV